MELWLKWAAELNAIAQNGLTFAHDQFDIERYTAIKKIAAEMLANPSENISSNDIFSVLLEDIGYATPRLDVRGAVFRDREILLVKEISDGKWTLPGGWADVNESPREAVEKEVREESGLITKAVKLIALYDKQKHEHPPHFPHSYKAFFLCQFISGDLSSSIETSDARFFAKEHLPELSLPRVLASQIYRCFEYLDNPDLPTDFD